MRYFAAKLVLLCFTSTLCAETLEEAVVFALQTNPRTQSKLMGYVSAKQLIGVARSEYLPQIDVSYDIGPERADNPATRAVDGGATRFTRRDAAINLRQRIFDWGKTYWNWMQSRASASTAAAEYYNAAEEVAFDAAEAYLNVIKLRQILNILIDNENVHYQMVKNITKKVEGGAGRKSELQLSNARYESSKARVTRAQQDLEDALNRYVEVIGRLPSEDMEIPEEILDPEQNLDNLLQIAITSNPAIAARRHDLHSKYAQYKNSQSAMLPTIEFRGTVYQGDNLEGVPGRNFLANALVVFNWDLYTGWRKTYQTRSDRALYFQAVADYDDTTRVIEKEVSTAFDLTRFDRERYLELKSYKENIYEFFQAQEQEFTLSLISLFDLLNSQTEYYNAFIDETNARIEIYRDRYRLLQTIGGLVNFILYFGNAAESCQAPVPEEEPSIPFIETPLDGGS